MVSRITLFSILISVVSVVLGIFAKQQHSAPPFFSVAPCHGDDLVSINNTENINIDPCHVFSETYLEAREKFREAATQAGAELYKLNVEVPPQISLQEDYSIDVAILRGTGPGLVLHTSGVHGVEGYAGSSVQIAFLESLYKKSRDISPTIVLVHAVNPYGMAHYRRTNENNVDLNRNAMHPDEWKKMAKAMKEPTAVYEAYSKFNPMFNPKGPPSWLYALVSWWLEGAQGLAQNGFDTLKAAMVTGQYYDPTGIFFGGQELQPSLAKLYDFLQSQVCETTTGTVTWIDVHTGLGPSGVDSILMGDGMTQDKQPLEREMNKWFPGARLPHLSSTAGDAQKGYDKVKGFTPRFFGTLFSDKSNHYLAMVQEFGTVPGILVAHALIVENRAYQHLPTKESVEWAARTAKRAFYKQTPLWRRQILERGLQLLLQAIERSASSATSTASVD